MALIFGTIFAMALIYGCWTSCNLFTSLPFRSRFFHFVKNVEQNLLFVSMCQSVHYLGNRKSFIFHRCGRNPAAVPRLLDGLSPILTYYDSIEFHDFGICWPCCIGIPLPNADGLSIHSVPAFPEISDEERLVSLWRRGPIASWAQVRGLWGCFTNIFLGFMGLQWDIPFGNSTLCYWKWKISSWFCCDNGAFRCVKIYQGVDIWPF